MTTTPDVTHVQALFTAFPEALFTLDARWSFTYVNPRAERLLREDARHLLGQVWWEVRPELCGTLLYTAAHEALLTGAPMRVETYAVRENAWWEVQLFRSGDGLGVQIRDVTAQHAQRQDLALLTQTVAESQDCVKVLDLDARLLFMNVGGLQAMEIDDFDACRNLLWADFWHADDHAKIQAALGRARAGQRAAFEGQANTARGRPKWWDVSVSPVRDEHGSVQHLLVISRDVTERRRAQDALADLNATLERRVVERTRQLEALGAARAAFVAFTEAAGTTSDMAQLARQAVHVLAAHAPNANVVYATRERGVWIPRVCSDHLPPAVLLAFRASLTEDSPALAALLRTQQLVFVPTGATPPPVPGRAVAHARMANVPLVIDGEVRGVLGVHLADRAAWRDEDLALVQAVARSLNLALERAAVTARLAAQHAKLDARARALEGFADLTRDLTLLSDPPALVRRAQALMLSMLPRGYARYFEPDGEHWRVRAQTGDDGSAARQATVDAGLPLDAARTLLHAWRARTPQYHNEYALGAGLDAHLTPQVRAVAALPVLVSGATVGVLTVALFEPRVWSAVDRAVLESTARSLGLALEAARAAREISDWRTRYEVAVRGSGHLLYDWDPASSRIVYGGALEAITGYTQDELDGTLEDWSERLIHPDDRDAFNAEIARVNERQDDFHLEFRVVRKDGRVRHVEDAGFFMRDADGVVTRMAGFVKDVTDRKRAEVASAHFAQLVEASRDGIGITDLNGHVTYLNRAARDLVGLPPGEPSSRAREHLNVVEGDEPRARLLRDGRWESNARLRHHVTGQPIEVRRTVLALKDPATGRPSGYGIITRHRRTRKAR